MIFFLNDKGFIYHLICAHGIVDIPSLFFPPFYCFRLNLIIAKLFLPNYGGSYLVWGACIVFFQAVLLAGYIFAHTFLRRLGTCSVI